MIRAYCVDDITILRWQGDDDWNEPLAALEIDVKGYVDWKTRLIRDINGEEVVSRGSVYILYDGDLTHQDRLKINGVEYSIITVRYVKDFSDVAQEVFLA